jgi:ATP dependent DNA ligase C terminal region
VKPDLPKRLIAEFLGTGFLVAAVKLKPLVVPNCPFVNLPKTHKARWGEAPTAEKMKKCVWVRPEIVAQIEFLEWTDADTLRHFKVRRTPR